MGSCFSDPVVAAKKIPKNTYNPMYYHPNPAKALLTSSVSRALMSNGIEIN